MVCVLPSEMPSTHIHSEAACGRVVARLRTRVLRPLMRLPETNPASPYLGWTIRAYFMRFVLPSLPCPRIRAALYAEISSFVGNEPIGEGLEFLERIDWFLDFWYRTGLFTTRWNSTPPDPWGRPSGREIVYGQFRDLNIGNFFDVPD